MLLPKTKIGLHNTLLPIGSHESKFLHTHHREVAYCYVAAAKVVERIIDIAFQSPGESNPCSILGIRKAK